MTNELTSVGRRHQQHFSPIIMRLRQLLAQSTAIAYTKQAHRELRVLRVPEFDPADVFGENIDNTTQPRQ